jgi:hypothetical protein
MTPNLKPPGTRRLQLKCDILLSTSAFKFNLRRYTKEADTWVALGSRQFIESGFDQSLESFTQALTLRRQALGRSHALTAGASTRPLLSWT